MAETGDVLEQIQKQLEGNTLGLSAVADVLQKMDARLEKAEEVEYEEELVKAEEAEYEALIKSVAGEVIAMIKADQEVGVEVKDKTVGGTKLDDDADDSPEDAAEDSATKDSADVIVSKMGKKPMMKEDDEDEDEDEDRDQDEVVQMKKQLEDLQKQVAGYQEALKKSDDNAVVDRLERMGFREENGLAAPKMISDESLGVESDSFISKGEQSEDVVEQLSKLSFKELRTLQERVESGQTEGLPTELYS